MFSYYGSKIKIAKFYPEPKYDLIIEPFAGSAWYSILYRHKNVLLNEKYEVIYKIWNWLINEATSEYILNNSRFYLGEDIRTFNFPEAYKYLVGYCINRGSSTPKNKILSWSCTDKNNPNFASDANRWLNRIAELLLEIKHWKVKFGDYKDLPDVEATWFIDPPYQYHNKYYKVKDVDYKELAEWCKSRKGQVIVCESIDADWLPFKPFCTTRGKRKERFEAIWTNNED